MRTVQKRADQLEPGDVVKNPQNERELLVVVQIGRVVLHRAHNFYMASASEVGPRLNSYGFAPGDLLDVKAPELTQAQQHAERLAEFAADYLALLEHDATPFSADRYAELRDLVAELFPPEPVTLAETLASLDALAGSPRRDVRDPELDVAIRLLERARRAGQVPK